MKIPTVTLSYPHATFACQNGSAGFTSYFEGILAPLRYLIVLKGGPGTGKSGIMKKLAEARERAGERTTVIICSSDPHSLDGVVFEDRKVAIVDGTAPHLIEASPAGARGETVDLLAFADKALLRRRAGKIEELSEKKRAACARGELCLAAAGKNAAARASLLTESLDRAKFDALIRRIQKVFPASKGAARKTQPQTAFCAGGSVRLNTWEEEAETILTVLPCYGAEFLVSAELDRRGAFLLSPDPVTLAPERLYDRERGALLRFGTRSDDEKTVGLRGVLSIDAPTRTALRENLRIEQALLAAAQREYASAANAHFTLEAIYGEAMDFSGFNELYKRLDGLISSL